MDLKEVGNYRIVDEIGCGSFGKVYLARHMMLDVDVCLKRGAKSVDNDNLMREFYYLKEFRNHPNIIKLYEIVFMESCIYLVMDYYPRGDLFDFVTNNGKLSVSVALKMFTQLAGAVYYIHSNGCCHRDLKLENVLLDEDNNVKLSDFGFTRELPLKSLLRDICGTNAYMAPELIRRMPYSGVKIDIWALGVMLYTLVTGEMPFDDSLDEAELNARILTSRPRFMDSLETDVQMLIEMLLQKEPEDRPASLDSVLKLPMLDKYGGKESCALVNKLKYCETSITRGEKAMFKDMVKIGFDKASLKEAIKTPQMDSTYAIWELLRENRLRKKKQRRPLLRMNTKTDMGEDPGLLRRSASIKNVKSLLAGSATDSGAGAGTGASAGAEPSKKFSLRSMFTKRRPSVGSAGGIKRVFSVASAISAASVASAVSGASAGGAGGASGGASGTSGTTGATASISSARVQSMRDEIDNDVVEGDIEEVNAAVTSLSLQAKRLRPGSVISGMSIQTTLSETSNGSGYVTGYSTDMTTGMPKYNRAGSGGNLSPVLGGSPTSQGTNAGGLSRQSSVDSLRGRKVRKRKDVSMSPVNNKTLLLKRGKSPLSSRITTTWKFNTPKHVKMKKRENNIIEEGDEDMEEDHQHADAVDPLMDEDFEPSEPQLHRKRFRRAPTLATPLETDEEGDDEDDDDDDLPYSPTPQRSNVVRKLEAVVNS